MPTPVAPPPMTIRSHGSRSSIARASNRSRSKRVGPASSPDPMRGPDIIPIFRARTQSYPTRLLGLERLTYLYAGSAGTADLLPFFRSVDGLGPSLAQFGRSIGGH